MDTDKIKHQLIIDEGYSESVYTDSLGFLTVGVGHLVVPADGLVFGERIDYHRAMDFLDNDFVNAVLGCGSLITGFETLPGEVQGVLVNMCFNLGADGLKQFHHFLAAIENHDWQTAAAEMENSLWFKQVGKRAERLCDTIKNIGGVIV